MTRAVKTPYRDDLATILSSELNTLADDTSCAASTVIITNNTIHDLFVDFQLDLASVDMSGQSSPSLAVYLIPSIDGTNYPDWEAGADPDPANEQYYVGSITIQELSKAHLQVLTDVALKTGKHQVALRNNCGAALAASGNTLGFRTHGYEST